jgi:hypothetical protein
MNGSFLATQPKNSRWCFTEGNKENEERELRLLGRAPERWATSRRICKRKQLILRYLVSFCRSQLPVLGSKVSDQSQPPLTLDILFPRGRTRPGTALETPDMAQSLGMVSPLPP